MFWKRQETSLALQAKEVSLMYKLSTKDAARSIQNQNPAQRSAEVVNEAQSARAVLILRGGATERVRDGVCFEKENAVANDTKSATTCITFALKMSFLYTKSKPGTAERRSCQRGAKRPCGFDFERRSDGASERRRLL